jgi:hypothetical protein
MNTVHTLGGDRVTASPAFHKSWRPSLVLGLVTFIFHLYVNRGYGIFRDELYFIVCGQHPAWGYVDQPPIIPLLAAGSYGLFGNFLIGFRLIPAIAMSATVALTAEFTRLIGGGRYSQWVAGLCALSAVYFLAIGLLFTTDIFQPLTWLACAWFLVRLEQSGEQRWWLPFGLTIGLSLQSKYLMVFYLLALAVGLTVTPLRRSLLRPCIYGGMLIALIIVLPNLLWQGAHDWPFLELGAAASHWKNLELSPLAFFGQQVLLLGPIAALVGIIGLWACVRRPQFSLFRALPVVYILLFAYFDLAHGKAYYMASVYPTLFAAGAVAIEARLRGALARTVPALAIAISGIILTPLAVPVLSEARYIAYASALGLNPAATGAERLKIGPLPQHFADMHGWQAMAEKVAAIYHALPPEDRAQAVFFGHNYGESAAIDVFGPSFGLPPAIGGHNNYWLWGPQGRDGSVMIVVGGERADYEEKFHSVAVEGETDDPYAMPSETNQPIYVLRGLHPPLAELWPKLKHYD